MTNMTRRAFLTTAALASASAALVRISPDVAMTPGPEGNEGSRSRNSFRRPQLVSVGRGQDYAAIARRALKALGGIDRIVGVDQRVLVKPTLAWNRLPGQGANVHPEVLGSVLEQILQAGAAQVLVLDRTALPSTVAYQVSGAARAVRAIGDSRVRLIHLVEADFVPLIDLMQAPVRAGDAGHLAQAQACRYLLEVDRVINIAAARHHPTRRVALGMANLLGLIGGGPADGAWLRHQGAELAVLCAAIRPDLTILDATRPVIRNGPMGRGRQDVARWDTIVASRDPVAVEAYGARLFGVDPAILSYLRMAEQLGSGAASLSRMRIVEVA